MVLDEIQTQILLNKNRLHIIREREEILREIISKLEAQKLKYPQAEVELERIDAALEKLKRTYDDVVEQQMAAKISRASNPEWTVTILNPASRASQRKTRDYVRMALGPAFSLIIALGLAFFVDNLDHSIKNISEAEEKRGDLICKDFGLEVDGKNKAQMLLELNAFLIRQNEANRNALLIIDEAHNLSPDVLEELRMLSNLETRDRKLLQIMLVGQPELESILNMKEMRQLRQRIPGICRISMLDRDGVEKYIKYRLDVARGGNGEAQFTTDSFDEIYHYSGGIPRLINILCDRALLIAYVANTRILDGRLIREGIRDLESPQSSGERSARA
jgi:hypothetical protein